MSQREFVLLLLDYIDVLSQDFVLRMVKNSELLVSRPEFELLQALKLGEAWVAETAV